MHMADYKNQESKACTEAHEKLARMSTGVKAEALRADTSTKSFTTEDASSINGTLGAP